MIFITYPSLKGSLDRPPIRSSRYNGHKKPCPQISKFSVANGLVGKNVGRKHDATMLYESGLLVQLENHAWFNR